MNKPGSKTFTAISISVAAVSILAAAVYWLLDSGSGTGHQIAVGVEAFGRVVVIFGILGLGFTFASILAIVALLRGEPRRLPIALIAVQSVVFVAIIVGLALS